MKNQYFGDVNDYRKYGLLRALTGPGELSAAVCWMLTPDDGRTDGRFVEYLSQRRKWRLHDPDLFDKLKKIVTSYGERNVRYAKEMELIPLARFYEEEVLRDDCSERSRYFACFWETTVGCDLVFFDPDNGMEVKSKPCGRRESSKYLYWCELEEAFSRGFSVLVYQHFPRAKRERFIRERAEEICERTGVGTVYSFRTAYVTFFLLPSESRLTALEQGVARVEKHWAGQIQAQRHTPSAEPQNRS